MPKLGHSSGPSWVWAGKKNNNKKKNLLLWVNRVHSTSSHSFEERGYENTNVIIMRDFNTFIKIETGISEFLLRAFKLKASLSYLKCCTGNNSWRFSLVRHLDTVTITAIFFFFWQTLIIRYWKKNTGHGFWLRNNKLYKCYT